MMIQRFRSFLSSCGVLILSLYCRGVLAADNAVNTVGTSTATTTTTTTTPQPPVTPGSQMLPQLADNKAMEGMLVMLGSMLLMVAVAWLLWIVLAKLAGKKVIFKKPLIIGLVGIVLIIISRYMVK